MSWNFWMLKSKSSLQLKKIRVCASHANTCYFYADWNQDPTKSSNVMRGLSSCTIWLIMYTVGPFWHPYIYVNCITAVPMHNYSAGLRQIFCKKILKNIKTIYMEPVKDADRDRVCYFATLFLIYPFWSEIAQNWISKTSYNISMPLAEN